MKLSQLALRYRGAIIQSRWSPISRTGSFLTFALLTIGIIVSIGTKFTLASIPNVLPLVMGILVLDALSQLVPQNRFVKAVQSFLHGLSYLVITVLCAVFAAYAMQRLAFPLQDRLLARADMALGLNWLDYAHWVDDHLAVQRLFHFAYDTIQIQIALPLVVLAFSNRPTELREYLLAFAIALFVTIVISALLPAAGPIASVDRTAFHILRFTGATPLDHLMRLREAGPLILTDPPGGIATFPSFHATVAVLIPLILRGYPRIFMCLLVLDAAMLGGTVTEGAHYFCDILAGAGMAFFAYALAKRIIRAEDRPLAHRSDQFVGRPYPVPLVASDNINSI
ncbi:MAG TPA: phosphatase PAP2 family protein [Pseudolabrys sp.]